MSDRGRRTLPVSLVMTVRNEAGSLPGLLRSVLDGSAQPAEVVIVDGGSSDGTQEIARLYAGKLPLRLIESPGANISEGRNLAIRSAKREVVAVTDAGVRLDPHWLERLVAPLLNGGEGTLPRPSVAGGFFVADPHGAFETAMGATVLPAESDIGRRRVGDVHLPAVEPLCCIQERGVGRSGRLPGVARLL